jgi:hypothetical protein
MARIDPKQHDWVWTSAEDISHADAGTVLEIFDDIDDAPLAWNVGYSTFEAVLTVVQDMRKAYAESLRHARPSPSSICELLAPVPMSM